MKYLILKRRKKRERGRENIPDIIKQDFIYKKIFTYT